MWALHSHLAQCLSFLIHSLKLKSSCSSEECKITIPYRKGKGNTLSKVPYGFLLNNGDVCDFFLTLVSLIFFSVHTYYIFRRKKREQTPYNVKPELRSGTDGSSVPDARCCLWASALPLAAGLLASPAAAMLPVIKSYPTYLRMCLPLPQGYR